MTREIISTDKSPAAIGPYSQGIVSGGMLFTAGQLGIDAGTGLFVCDTAAGQAVKALENARAVIEAGGMTFDDVVKVTVFLRDMNDFAAVNEVYSKFFSQDPPARSAVEVA
ncbi:MAG: reactive intermediate/imine deaminase, partial [bacterium]|nr:reactive intermediate/imine deaminase [bacterium]